MFFGKRVDGSGDKGDGLGDEMEGYILGRSSINSGGSYDEYRETAAKIAEKVSESAKVLKDKALDWLQTLSSG